MKIISANDNIDAIITEIVTILKNGGIVVMPSDTVYGLCCDGTNEKAVKKLIEFKRRSPGKAISVFVDGIEGAKKTVDVSAQNLNTIENLAPGPFTFILPSKHTVVRDLEAENGTLGIRIPDDTFINQLMKVYPNPVTATSANLSGTSPHYSTKSLLNNLSQKKKNMIDLVVDAGKLPRNKPSTVIDLTSDNLKILRQGDVSASIAQTIISKSEQQTKKIAQQLIQKWEHSKKDKPLVIILKGDLGTGKTQFVKGIGEEYGISNIISPTFVVYYEYKIPETSRYLYHVDLYNVMDKNEFKYLGFEKMLKPGNIICIEWGEKSGEVSELLKIGEQIFITIVHRDENERKITINSV